MRLPPSVIFSFLPGTVLMRNSFIIVFYGISNCTWWYIFSDDKWMLFILILLPYLNPKDLALDWLTCTLQSTYIVAYCIQIPFWCKERILMISFHWCIIYLLFIILYSIFIIVYCIAPANHNIPSCTKPIMLLAAQLQRAGWFFFSTQCSCTRDYITRGSYYFFLRWNGDCVPRTAPRLDNDFFKKASENLWESPEGTLPHVGMKIKRPWEWVCVWAAINI